MGSNQFSQMGLISKLFNGCPVLAVIVPIIIKYADYLTAVKQTKAMSLTKNVVA